VDISYTTQRRVLMATKIYTFITLARVMKI